MSLADTLNNWPAPSGGWTGSAHPVDEAKLRAHRIEQSHLRCAALGLSRVDPQSAELMLTSDLRLVRERNQRLSDHAAPVMEMLFEQIVNTGSMVVLTDAHGTILHSVGDGAFVDRANRVSLSPGANWAEQSRGTNAIGTALVEEIPTSVHAAEHFMHANSFLTCSAAPIFDPRGNMLGVLDVSGDQHSYHQHTMGLVRMSARMIENHWLTDDCAHRLRLHFHARPEFIGTLLEGILVVGADGRVVGANRSALDQLGLSSAAVRMQTLCSFFNTSLSAVLDHLRSPMAPFMRLHLQDGRMLHVSPRSNGLVQAIALSAGLTQSRDEGTTESVMGMDRSTSVSKAPAETIGWMEGRTPVEVKSLASHRNAEAVRSDPAADRARDEARSAKPGAADGQRSLSGLHYLRTGDVRMEALVDKVMRILNRDIPLMILGETGTGKELLARAVHQDSHRARQPFVAVNCASIPETLIEAELFGYEEGAFTGARRKGAMGRILQANGGTLFLDEIGDMPLPLQAHLLRVLQDRCVTPLGSQKSIPVDITVMSATHRDLRTMIEQGKFREDLYYRLNGLVVRLPALRDRSDMPVVARRILAQEGVVGQMEISGQVMGMFRRYHWPGNIRQMATVLRTAVVMATGEREITENHLSDDFLEDVRRMPATNGGAGAASTTEVGARMAMNRSGVTPVWGTAACPSKAPEWRDVSTPLHSLQSHEASVGGNPFVGGGGTAHVVPGTTGASALFGAPEGYGMPASVVPNGLMPAAFVDPGSPVDPAVGASASSVPARTLGEAEIDLIRAAVEAAQGNISVASKRLGISRNTIYRKLRWTQRP